MELNSDVVFKPLPALEHPLGPLADLIGTWEGTGFNIIWRPNSTPGQDRFLEINRTNDSIRFDEIPGEIPNRGLLQEDIVMRGLTYLQQVTDANMNVALHIEPGIWALVPPTVNPPVEQTVVRMASIPHGTAFVAQGTATVRDGSPVIPDNDIFPFSVGQSANKIRSLPEQQLSQATDFRSPSEQLVDVQQQMLDNPNSILKAAIAAQQIVSTTTLLVTTTCDPTPGGGTANTAFLQGTSNQPNAKATSIETTFWIETLKGEPNTFQLQYSQTVLLNFNGLSWPHVSVGTLQKKSVV